MGSQRLSERSTRRIARSTGLDVVRAWAHGGYTFEFVTLDHRHGWWDKKTGEWGLDAGKPTHYTSCHELFPQDFPAEQNERYKALGII
jgi:hypothetical protein